MSDSHYRVAQSVEKCLMEELRKGVGTDVDLAPFKSIRLLRLSSSVTKEVLEKMIADEIQHDRFSVALNEGRRYADENLAFVNFESAEAADEAKSKLDSLMAKHKERGDQSVFTAVSLIGFQINMIVYAGILSDLTTEDLLTAEGEKLDGFRESALLTFSDNFRYGLLYFCSSQQADAAISRLKKLKAKYRDGGVESIFLKSTGFRFGIPKVPNPEGFCVVHADNLKSGVTEAHLHKIANRRLTIYGCVSVTKLGESAIFGFDSPEGASWGFHVLINLQKWNVNNGDSIFTPESELSWPQM